MGFTCHNILLTQSNNKASIRNIAHKGKSNSQMTTQHIRVSFILRGCYVRYIVMNVDSSIGLVDYCRLYQFNKSEKFSLTLHVFMSVLCLSRIPNMF